MKGGETGNQKVFLPDSNYIFEKLQETMTILKLLSRSFY